MSKVDAHPNVAESDIYIGNQLDKANTTNPLYRRLIDRFDACLLDAVRRVSPGSLHEVGCGEGRLSTKIQDALGIPIRASDFSQQLITENLKKGHAGIQYLQRSIYELNPKEDSAAMLVCCEVLEHLEFPDKGIQKLANLDANYYLLSVPREPIWRMLNMLRLQYLRELGNTPGHLNHWSKRSFLRWVRNHGFSVVQEYHPFPWTMALVKRDR